MREVSRVRSTRQPVRTQRVRRSSPEKGDRLKRKLEAPFGKERIDGKKLNPYYVAGFIDGEGCFSVSMGKHKTLKRGTEIRPEFEIEVRADDRDVLERICITIGVGRIYDLSYERYGWHPHVKYKIGGRKDMVQYLFPFLDRYPLQAKKRSDYKLFKKIVMLMERKAHLTDAGYHKIIALREQIRSSGKKHAHQNR